LQFAPPALAEDAQAFQPYTFGSTGRPKGAIMTHRGMLWYVSYNQRYWPASESERGLVALPLCYAPGAVDFAHFVRTETQATATIA
jgi:long-chain acyl-CoA synthetase